jgi:hypothetical protein
MRAEKTKTQSSLAPALKILPKIPDDGEAVETKSWGTNSIAGQ